MTIIVILSLGMGENNATHKRPNYIRRDTLTAAAALYKSKAAKMLFFPYFCYHQVSMVTRRVIVGVVFLLLSSWFISLVGNQTRASCNQLNAALQEHLSRILAK